MNAQPPRGAAGLAHWSQIIGKPAVAPVPAPPAARFEVRTRKTSGAVIVFNVYSTLTEATAIARRLGEVGASAFVVEVRHA